MTKKELTFTIDEMNIFSNRDVDFKNVLVALNNISRATSEDELNEVKKTLAFNRNKVYDLWRKYKELEKILKMFKESMEYAISTFTNENGDTGVFQNDFKWRKGSKTITCSDMEWLFNEAQNAGTSYGFLHMLKPMTAKDAADVLGLSESRLLESYGDKFESKQNKPTLIGL